MHRFPEEFPESSVLGLTMLGSGVSGLPPSTWMDLLTEPFYIPLVTMEILVKLAATWRLGP